MAPTPISTTSGTRSSAPAPCPSSNGTAHLLGVVDGVLDELDGGERVKDADLGHLLSLLWSYLATDFAGERNLTIDERKLSCSEDQVAYGH